MITFSRRQLVELTAVDAVTPPQDDAPSREGTEDFDALMLPADGTTDCTKILQQKLDRDGGAKLSRGVFRVRDLVMPPGSSLVGIGTNLYRPPAATGSVLSPAGDCSALVHPREGSHLAGVTLNGEERSVNGIQLDKRSDSTTIQNCCIQFCRAGIDGGYAGTVQVSSSKIGRNHIGVRDLVDSLITGSYIFGNLSHGISFRRGANDNVIASSKIEWNRGANIYLRESLSVVMTGCIIDRGFLSGLAIESGDAVISSCLFKRNGRLEGSHIDATSVQRLVVSACMFKSGGDDGTRAAPTPESSVALFGECGVISLSGNISYGVPLLVGSDRAKQILGDRPQ